MSFLLSIDMFATYLLKGHKQLIIESNNVLSAHRDRNFINR